MSAFPSYRDQVAYANKGKLMYWCWDDNCFFFTEDKNNAKKHRNSAGHPVIEGKVLE